MVGTAGVDVLWDAVRALASHERTRLLTEAYADMSLAVYPYNFGLLCCLLKKSPGRLLGGMSYYTADHTLSLSIVSCDNRLVARAMRIRWEGILEAWVSDFQQGFLPGRSMLANVIDIDLNAMLVSLKDENGAVVVLDFSAAFPSVSH